jgi:hypothetical protein
MGRAATVAWVTFAVSALFGELPRVAGQSADTEDVTALALLRCPELITLLQSDNWVEELFSPIVSDERELRQRQQSYRKIYACLSHLETQQRLPDRLSVIQKGTEYFLTFAGTSPSPPELLIRRERILMETSEDPAVVILRDEVGLPAPTGFVYLVYFPNRQSLPEFLRSAFQDESTQAVTFMCRYVAILSKPDELLREGERKLKKRRLPKIVSHELAHAYINCSVGLMDHDKLPKWFHEGCAIYYSGSGGSDVVTELKRTGHGWVETQYRVRDPKDYAEYKVVFEYLDSRLGTQELNRAIKESVTAASAEEILKSVGAASYDELVKSATAWRRKWHLIYFVILLVVLVGVPFFIWMILPRERRPPSV